MHLANMVQGVCAGFEKQLQIEGIGYRAAVEGKDLVLNIGFTHPVRIIAPADIAFKVEKNIVNGFGLRQGNSGKNCRAGPPGAPAGTI